MKFCVKGRRFWSPIFKSLLFAFDALIFTVQADKLVAHNLTQFRKRLTPVGSKLLGLVFGFKDVSKSNLIVIDHLLQFYFFVVCSLIIVDKGTY